MDRSGEYRIRMIRMLGGVAAYEFGHRIAEGLALLCQIAPGARTADIDTTTLAEFLGRTEPPAKEA